jgi:hypothetical protein
MTMNINLLVVILIGVASAASAGQNRPTDARLSMPYLGIATMLDDGTLTLHLRLSNDGKPVDETLTYKVSDRAYDNILRHIGGLRPGETKEFRPWKD